MSAVFYQISIFSPNGSPLKTIKNVFLFHLKNSSRSRDIQNFCNFFPSFPHLPNSKGQIEVQQFMVS